MNRAQHIIVVDDEAAAREMIGDYLRMHGFSVSQCDGGKSLRTELAKEPADLIVLDLNMPEEDGLSIIRDLKRTSNVSIIMLTATASPIDRVVGLEIGADDYLAKPCELRELLARVRSVLRRSATVAAGAAPAAAAAPEPAKPEKNLVRFGTKWLDLDEQLLKDEEGNAHPLTASEFNLLKAFAANPRRVLTRESLLRLSQRPRSRCFRSCGRHPDHANPAQDRARSGASKCNSYGPQRRLPVLAHRRKAAAGIRPPRQRIRGLFFPLICVEGVTDELCRPSPAPGFGLCNSPRTSGRAKDCPARIFRSFPPIVSWRRTATKQLARNGSNVSSLHAK